MGSHGNGPNDYYAPGDHNAICSMCGHKKKASQLRKHWQGQWRCEKCWESRHPQDFVKAVLDIQTPAWTQPDTTSSSDYVAACTLCGLVAIAGVGTAGCMVAGYVPAGFNPDDCPTD